LFAEDSFTGRGSGDDLLAVQRVRARQHDGIDAGVDKHLLEPANELDAITGSVVAQPIGVAADGVGEAQPVALALDRLDERLTPPAKADDRGVDHRPGRRQLSPGSAEMPVKEVKHLMPSVDRLLGAVIRTIMRKERMAGAVIAVELVVLA